MDAVGKLFETAVPDGDVPAADRAHMHALLDAGVDLKVKANQMILSVLRCE